MKFTNTHKVFSVALSFLVLLSTLSITIEKHFCGGVLVDVAIFTHTEKCGMEVLVNDKTEVIKKSCCKDEIDTVESQTDLTINSYDDLDSIQKQVVLAYSFSYAKLFEALPQLVVPHKDYNPPKLIEDIQLLDEVYLI